MTKLDEDGSGQQYIKVGAIRVTFIAKRAPSKDWAEGPVIRFSAYADPNGHHSGKVYPGPEYPIGEDGVLPLIEALYRLERAQQKV